MNTDNQTNVDPQEVLKFEQVASRWWDPGGDFKTLHDINPFRLKYIDDRAQLRGKRVVDVGCGGGILAESMALKGAEVTAIDASAAALDTARLHQYQSGTDVEYQHCTPEEFAAAHAQEFDVVTCLEMLEHVPDPSSVIQACAAMTRSGGHVFFSTLNRNAQSYLAAVLGAEYILRLLPKGTHDYARFLRPSELAAALRTTGFALRDITGMAYNPFNGRCAATRTPTVNYIVHALHEGG